jgi:methionine aminopeptidase
MYKQIMNLKYPRLTYLGIGLFVGILMAGILGNHYDNVITQQYELTQKMIETNERLVTEQHKKIETLSQELKSVREKAKTHKIIHSDGSSEEWTESESETVESKLTKVKEEERIRQEKEKLKLVKEYEEKLTISKSERKKLKVMAGLHSDMRKFLMADYTFWGPFGVNGGIVFSEINKPTYTLGLSWSF